MIQKNYGVAASIGEELVSARLSQEAVSHVV
jgi:hypothetical protein